MICMIRHNVLADEDYTRYCLLEGDYVRWLMYIGTVVYEI